MGIQSGINGSGGIFPQRRPDEYIEGAPAQSRLPFANTYSNPILAQVSTVTIAGTATDGTYTFDVLLPSGAVITVAFARASAESNTEIAEELRDVANGLAALNGVLLATASTGVITLTFEHEGIVYPIQTLAAPSPGTIATADTQAAGGVAQALARFVDRGTADARGFPTVAALSANSNEGTIGGILMRPIGEIPGIDATGSLNPQDPAQPDLLPAPGLGAVAYEGAVAMRNNGSVATVPGGQVFAVIDVAGGDQLGQARSNAEGTVAKVVTATPTAANDTDYQLTIHFPDNEEFVFEITSDASGTATEICDAFRTLMAADTAFTARIVATGTATLILTGQVGGEDWTVIDSGPGAWASITVTTAADSNTVALPTTFARWLKATAAGAVGPLFVRTI